MNFRLRSRILALGLALMAGFATPAFAQAPMVSVFPEDQVASMRARDPSSVALPGGGTPWFASPDLSTYIDEARALRRNPPRSLRGASSLACIAVAIYHEARGEDVAGQYAVASVIMQRALVPGRWGDTPCAVVRPVQFSFMTSRYGFPPIRDDRAWGRALDIAGRSLVAGPHPALAAADHYHADYVDPDWADAMEPVLRIGRHLFYRDPLSRSGF